MPVNQAKREIGVGQTWQNVSGSRSAGTTYTNTTGKPILVSILNNVTVNGQLSVNGIAVAWSHDSSQNRGLMLAVVPPNATYSVNSFYSGSWAELR